MPPVRRLADEPAETVPAQRAEAPPEPAVLALQRSAGNAAVAQMLARDALSMRNPPAKSRIDDPLGVSGAAA